MTKRPPPPRRSYPLFVYLMSSGNAPFIGVASNPFLRLRCHNREPGLPSGAKSTRHGAPRWQLRVVIGPFYRGSRSFHDQWRKESRKLSCRIAHGTLKAISYRSRGLCIWADDPQEVIRICISNIKRHNRRLQSVYRHRDISQIATRPLPVQSPQAVTSQSGFTNDASLASSPVSSRRVAREVQTRGIKRVPPVSGETP